MSKTGTEYRILSKKFRNKCRQAKKEWLSEKLNKNAKNEHHSYGRYALKNKRNNRTKDVLLNRMHKINKKLTVHNRERKMTSKG